MAYKADRGWGLIFVPVNFPCDISRINVGCELYSSLRGDKEPVYAYERRDRLILTIRVPRRICADSVVFRLYADADGRVSEYTLRLLEFGDAEDIYSEELSLSEVCTDDYGGLFFFDCLINTPFGAFTAGHECGMGGADDTSRRQQLTVYEDGFETPLGFADGIMYQIFPDRFYDNGTPILPEDGRKIYDPDWDSGVPEYADETGGYIKNNRFFGGNLQGISAKLDYLCSLGVKSIYLCPIFESASNHKYDTGDYTRVDRMFGGEEGLRELISGCRERGMRLILDGVFNHTGSDSIYFNKYGHYPVIGAYNSPDSEYYGWYSFSEYPEHYSCWWGIDILPAVSGDNESFVKFICDEVIRRYLGMGIDGWRLDVADELSDTFLERLRAAAKDENPDSIILGEVWEDASIKIAYGKRRKYFMGRQLDSVMNYPLRNAIIEFILTRNSSCLKNTAIGLWSHYPKQVSRVMMNFLGTHDTPRILSVLADVGIEKMNPKTLAEYRLPPETRRIAVERLKLAWGLLAAFPGIPCIYYGDEAGMEGGGDPFNRMPFIWGREDMELAEFFRKIGKIRKNEPLFSLGGMEIPETGDDRCFMIIREGGDGVVAAAVNLSDLPWEIELGGHAVGLISGEEWDGSCVLEAGGIEYYRL